MYVSFLQIPFVYIPEVFSVIYTFLPFSDPKTQPDQIVMRAGGSCKIKTALPEAAPSVAFYLSLRCSQCWFATLQEVLLADWHDVWHSPHPPLVFDSAMSLVVIVLILFIVIPPFS